jgi:CheY-like chemotaxis protein
MATRRILVIDDEASVVTLLERVLTRAGYLVATASTGEEAIEKIERALVNGPYDLLVVDKSLPRMHGFEVITRARRLQPGVGVVMITAYPEPFTSSQERLDGYLGKPFKSIKAIEDVVKTALESRDASAARQELTTQLDQVIAELKPVAKKSL